ncbi:PTS nitrogen regulatory IIA subunit [Enterovibrio norvegicus FF-33]|uniref:PTS nitrogen regulatory IIA subunit n=1 Tax=Enterovibrio norvegicus FF-454 TaxID=1185651 RepID=A0A1E5BYQ3_9GAMM|nr:PTS sugar transporter subunit IIA [Enterovibrio norvegicus]OEE58387.1 PTS nitrogen regulatory IIA subunit [Enterovibrio norvegicus FF-454]OEE70318.1 PTS nitrogen regulatory IIA subunit [Enterovibrio norvegicus FF-33]
MITRRITFFIGEEGLPAWRLNRLRTLAGHFRSVTIFVNLSQRKSANAEQPMHILSLSALPSDLCQLQIEGNDAELASMVLTDFIDEHASLISGGKSSAPITPSDHQSLPFDFVTHRLRDTELDKHGLLAQFALMVAKHENCNQETLFDALYKRESVSSTSMGNGVALPHVMTPEVKHAHLLIATTHAPLNWASQRGNVSCVIGLMLPTPPVRESIVAFSGFSQQLLEADFCAYLTENNSADILELLILNALNVPFR